MQTCSCCNQTLDDSKFVKKAMPEPDVCKLCRARKSRKEYTARNPEKAQGDIARWHAENKWYKRLWKAKNPEKVKAYRKTSYERNPQAWMVSARKREFAKAQRTPSWELELTELVYAEAVDLRIRRGLVTGFVWEIDHQVPLQGNRVSGLHVWNNLRVIPQTLNRRKFNTYDIV
jgi:hypothetical protein